jgi:hypothetical protein
MAGFVDRSFPPGRFPNTLAAAAIERDLGDNSSTSTTLAAVPTGNRASLFVDSHALVSASGTVDPPSSTGALLTYVLTPVSAAGGNITLTMPSIADVYIKGSVLIVPDGADLMDYGAPTVQLTTQNQVQQFTIYDDGVNPPMWWSI